MGVDISVKDGYVVASVKKIIKSTKFKLKKRSVGCTHFFLCFRV